MSDKEKRRSHNSALIFKRRMPALLAWATRHLIPTLLLQGCIHRSVRKNWPTLADVSLGEASNGAMDRDLLQAVRGHHLQAPCAGIFPHDVHNLTRT